MTIAVFGFGAFTLMGRQFVDPSARDKVLFIESMFYVPVLPTMQVIDSYIYSEKILLVALLKIAVFSVSGLVETGSRSRRRFG